MRREVLKGLFFAATCQLLLSGCYKKDLQEFESLNIKSHDQDFAFPLFESSFTINEQLPFDVPSVAYSDTVIVDLSLDSYLSGDLYNDLNYVEFKVITQNNFPARANLQIYFANENHKIIDSLFSVKRSTFQTSNGSTMHESTILIYMDKTKYKKIEKSSRMLIAYSLATDSSQPFVPYKFNVQSGIRFGITSTD